LPSAINFEIIVQSGWETVGLTFQFSLFNGGPASMVYGGIIAAIGATSIAASLAEMASMFVFVFSSSSVTRYSASHVADSLSE
jgi:hypothetical protein